MTESTLDLGHQHVKRNQTRFSRYLHRQGHGHRQHPLTTNPPRFCSYITENNDILVRLGWTSDPLLLWERDVGQKIKPGNMRKAKAEIQLENSAEDMPFGNTLTFCGCFANPFPVQCLWTSLLQMRWNSWLEPHFSS